VGETTPRASVCDSFSFPSHTATVTGALSHVTAIDNRVDHAGVLSNTDVNQSDLDMTLTDTPPRLDQIHAHTPMSTSVLQHSDSSCNTSGALSAYPHAHAAPLGVHQGAASPWMVCNAHMVHSSHHTKSEPQMCQSLDMEHTHTTSVQSQTRTHSRNQIAMCECVGVCSCALSNTPPASEETHTFFTASCMLTSFFVFPFSPLLHIVLLVCLIFVVAIFVHVFLDSG
jgi:hypothetical protein